MELSMYFAGVAAWKETVIHIAWIPVKLLNWDFHLSKRLKQCSMTASLVSN